MIVALQYTTVDAVAHFRLFPVPSRRRLIQEEALDLVPQRAPHAEVTEAGEELVISVRRREGGLVKILGWFFTLPARKTFQLDRIGAMVWRLCDGSNTVRAISDRVGAEFGWPAEQSRKATLQFLAYLSERRLVGFPASGRRADAS